MKNHLLAIISLLAVTTILTYTSTQAQTPTLWGMTESSGNGDGTLFGVDTTGAMITNYGFTGANSGAFPYGNLIEINDTLYGLSPGGGTNDRGVIFNYNLATGTETVLYDFGSDTDGADPFASLLHASNGLLYGTTVSGGPHSFAGEPDNGGTLFSYSISTGKETVLHSFGAGTDGVGPECALIQVNNLLYGTTVLGGTNASPYNDGTLFSFNIATGVETVLHSFGAGNDGQEPDGAPILVNDTLLYGTTTFGGTDDSGVIYCYNILRGTETVVYNFGGGTDGAFLDCSLILANNGLLYGMTRDGGAVDSGAIFSFDPSKNKETVLHSFGSGTDGQQPYGSLIQASNGLLYGMTNGGGTYDSGMIFSYNISTGAETDIHDFTGSDGASPYGSLLEVTNASAGINQLTVDKGQLTVYPNPSSGEFIISSTENIDEITVIDLLGQVIYKSPSGDLGVMRQTIDLSDYSDGIYFLTVKAGEVLYTSKIVVSK